MQDWRRDIVTLCTTRRQEIFNNGELTVIPTTLAFGIEPPINFPILERALHQFEYRLYQHQIQGETFELFQLPIKLEAEPYTMLTIEDLDDAISDYKDNTIASSEVKCLLRLPWEITISYDHHTLKLRTRLAFFKNKEISDVNTK